MSNVLVKINDKWHSVDSVVADELAQVRKDLRDARVMLGMLYTPDQQYYAGTPVHEFLTEMHQLRDFRAQVEAVLADSTEYFEWNDAIESIDRIRKRLVPLVAELAKNPKEQS